jgi:hypothetical protein
MSAVRRGDAIRSHPGRPYSRSAGRIDQAHTALRHYVVFRATTSADGSTASHYEVPGPTELLDERGFNAWRREHLPSGRDIDRAGQSHLARWPGVAAASRYRPGTRSKTSNQDYCPTSLILW